MRLMHGTAMTLLATALLAAAATSASLAASPASPGETASADEAAARAFLDRAEATLLEHWIKSERASWVQSNFITGDTETIAANARAELVGVTMDLAAEAATFDGADLPADVRRKLRMIKTSQPLAAPRDPRLQAELSGITAEMESIYGRGKYCPDGDPAHCMDLTELSRILADSRDPAQLLDAWVGWRTISPPIRPLFERFVELANAGARDLGFADLGELWRSGYDMPPDEFAAEVERLWQQVRPLYEALHCHVRARLAQVYGEDVVPPGRPIPAHLLGNMWSQSWANVEPLVAPEGSEPGYDLTRLLVDHGVDARGMVRYGEAFFTSLGFDPLPSTFWDRSLFTKPADRDVVCHASAWDIDWDEDLRIKMCIDVTAEDFVTVHHELGHNFYQRAYNRQDPLYRTGANDGFHEGIGDTIALSITPDYLVRVGLLDKAPQGGDLGLLMRMALDKIAFLPFGLLVDQFRWKVFSGEIAPDEYNAAWWALRERYQGIRPPVERSEADFDPGAKYHVPANTPYTRYFLATILQFQFDKALCDLAGYEGPLLRCSIYGNRQAGARLAAMLEMGASRPWPDALEALTGSRRMDAGPMLEYFKPLADWLDEQNRGRTCGW